MLKILAGKTLPRRTLLKGVGASLALPFLDAMFPAFGLRGQTDAWPRASIPDVLRPERDGDGVLVAHGSGARLSGSHRFSSPSRLFGTRCWFFPESGRIGSRSMPGASGSFLTGIPQGGRTETEIFADVSMDQLLARKFGQETQLASLELSMDAPANAGACSSNLSCVYTHTLSWRGPEQPLPTEYNPRAVFERLFGDAGSTERGAREARLRQQKSILDSVTDKIGALSREIGAQDQIKVEQYTEAIRDVERRIQKAEEQIDIDLPNFEQPEGAPPVFEDHLELMMDLKLLALQADLTRVITFMIGKEQSPRPYPQIDVPDAHHPLSHHNNQPDLVERMSRINRYHTQLFARYLTKLRETPDVDGTLLDNMTILYGSGISNSTRHSGDNLPLLVMGGGAGGLQGGQHLTYSDEPGMANLLVTLMDKMGLPVDRIGASTGALQIDALPGI